MINPNFIYKNNKSETMRQKLLRIIKMLIDTKQSD